MCDPLSAAGSVIAVVTVAAQSCDFLCTFFRSYQDTAEYLKHYISTLEALKSVFASIAELENSTPRYLEFDQGLRGRLEECGHHLQAIEKVVMPSHNSLGISKADRLWTKVKWSTAFQRQKIDKLMVRIESHCRTFIMTLLLLNTRLSLMSIRNDPHRKERVNLRVDKLRRKHITLHPQAMLIRHLRTPDAKARTHSRLSLHSPSTATVKPQMISKARRISYQSQRKAGEIEQTLINTTSHNTPVAAILRGSDTIPTHLEQSVTKWKAPEREDLCFRISLAKRLESLMPLLCWTGHVDRRETFSEKVPSLTRTHMHGGYAIGFAVTTYWCFALRLEFLLYIFVRPKRRSVSLSFGCELKFPSVVTWNSEIVGLALRGDVDSMKISFAARAASPFDVLPNGSTLLHLAAMENRFSMVVFLIQQGASLNAADDFGDTPLHRSLELAKDYNISRILIENGADLCNRNVDGETPLHTHFSPVMENVLLAHACLPDYTVLDGHGKTLLHHLAWSSRTSRATFERVSERSGGRIHNIFDGNQRSVLHHAAQRGNIAIVDYILARGDRIINTKDKIGRTPLHYAVESSRSEAVIKLLVSNGADVNATDNAGCSALHLAVKRDKETAIQTLSSFGLPSQVLVEGYRGPLALQVAEKQDPCSGFPASTHTIDPRQRCRPVSDQASSSSGREALKARLRIHLLDGLEDIGWKKGDEGSLCGYLFGLVSRRITPAGVTPLREAMRMLAWAAFLLCVILLIVR